MKKILSLTILIFSGSAPASDAVGTIQGHFEGRSGIEYFKYDPSNIVAGVSYYSKSVGGVRRYKINVAGECDILQIYKPEKSKDKIIVDGSCEGQGSQVLQYIYQWDLRYNDWCLREEVSGERADNISGSREHLVSEKVTDCIPLGSAQN